MVTLHKKKGSLLNVYLVERQKRVGKNMVHSYCRSWFWTDKKLFLFIARSKLAATGGWVGRVKKISSFRGGLDNFMDNGLKNRFYKEQSGLISPIQQLWMQEQYEGSSLQKAARLVHSPHEICPNVTTRDTLLG